MATTHNRLARHGAFWLLLGLGTMMGCGAGEVAVEVDMLSFIEEEQRGPSNYFVPAGAVIPLTQAIEPQRVELVDGLSELVAVEAVLVNLGLEIDNQNGDGDLIVRLYMTPATDDAPYVYDTTPIYVGNLALQPQTIATLAAELGSTPENGLAEAFEHGSLTVGLALSFDASGSPTPVEGSWSFAELTALVRGITSVSP